MLYDLNIAWLPGTPPTELERTLKFARHLGYDVVALNHIISGAIPTQPTPITNPIPQLTTPHPSFPGGTSVKPPPTTSSSLPSSTTTTTNLSTTAASALPPTTPTTTTPNNPSSLPTILRRATLLITDPSTTNYRLADFARAYDLLAVRPTSDKAFSWACLSATATSASGGGDPPALVSLDLGSHLGWHVHHRTAMAAVQRGVRFEVCYAQAFGDHQGNNNTGLDVARQRANFIGNLQALVRATKGRGIVLSSEARGALGLRAPADVVNLMAVWGLGPEKGFAAFGEGARAVVVNEGIKRRGFRGVVDVIQPAEGGGKKIGEGEGEGDREGGAGDGGKKQKQKQKGQGQQQGQKRKNGDAGGGGGGPQGQMSKRQAKKMKKDAPPAKV